MSVRVREESELRQSFYDIQLLNLPLSFQHSLPPALFPVNSLWISKSG